MALTFADYVNTKTFTPQEYQLEILSSAKNKNVIISLEGITNKVFVILKLIQELAFKMHRKSEKRKLTLLVLEEAEVDQYMFSIRHLTDLKPLATKPPPSPLLRNVNDPEGELTKLVDGFQTFEQHLGYRFQDRSYLLQAMTHASYYPNCLTDCYQRLEFLGDAVLDYLITRHLYEDKKRHSPGALTDLRSALVNNTIFAVLAVRNGFHKYLKHLSSGLSEVVYRYVAIQEDNGHTIDEEFCFLEEDDFEDAEDVEAPKVLGDIFESVAGAIYLDSNMSLDAVWKVYHKIMENEIKQFSKNVPISPVRELLELKPNTAKFSKPEKLADGRRVRGVVEILSNGVYKGIGRNCRIAKCTAAKCALKHLKEKIKK